MARRRSRRNSQADEAGFFIFVLVPLAVLIAITAAHPLVGGMLFSAAAGLVVWLVIRRVEARKQRRALWAVRVNAISSYMTMDAREFEHALAALCRRDGCTNVRVVGEPGDLAADVIATTPDGRRIVLQAKRFGPNTSVGSPDVQKVNGTYQHAHGAQLAAIVTTSRFTRPAREYGQRVGIRLFDQHALAGWVSRTGPAPWH